MDSKPAAPSYRRNTGTQPLIELRSRRAHAGVKAAERERNRLSWSPSRPGLHSHGDGRAVEIGNQPADRIVALNEALARADEQVDILVGDRQPRRDRLQTLAFLWVGNARKRYMDERAAHIGAIMPLDDLGLGATGFPQALNQLAQLAGGQDQGFEIVGINLGAGNGPKNLAETSYNPLLR